MKKKRATSRWLSALSEVIAAVLLTTTVFTSGVFAAIATDNYTIEIFNGGEKIELKNPPFIENGEVYLPLRETFEKVGAMEDDTAYINWDNGEITVFLGNNYDYDDDRFELEIGKKQLIYNPSSELPNSGAIRDMEYSPIMRNDKTYVPYLYAVYMLKDSRDIQYTVYDLIRK